MGHRVGNVANSATREAVPGRKQGKRRKQCGIVSLVRVGPWGRWRKITDHGVSPTDPGGGTGLPKEPSLRVSAVITLTIIVSAVGLVVITLFYLLPALERAWQGFETSIPLPTQVVFRVRSPWFLLLMGAGTIACLSAVVHVVRHFLCRRLPLSGATMRRANTDRRGGTRGSKGGNERL